ncbi:hypothetical protein QMA04_04330 [Planococcus sp. APC 3900]|uniref:hypothetical protein n=1 Tax=Planococcus sp. APC 3900 TaxID=3035191 RepID=UPI0025B581A5|nr:hypothetical protein [Planococcus sp. APC 3900]MDN3437304.1 hypothetical protein [Planococcus sp. APC 3900]
MDSVQEQVEKEYMHSDRLIHAYPGKPDSEVLSESLGLYMEYLLLAGDEQNFQEQVSILKNQFLVNEDALSFIQWRLNEKATTNALIDDIRILSVLQRAADAFENTAYDELADELSIALSSVQVHNDYTVDYYDWSYSLSAQRLTLSYATDSQVISEKSVELLKKVDSTRAFFPEYYDTKQQKYINSDEVHLIDQLLIAINREKENLHSESFFNWLKEEWNNEQRLYGRYNRETKDATVDYESLAVYYYLQSYFLLTGEEEMAREVVQQAKNIASEEMLAQAHFFDYIHYQLMLQEQ